VVSLPWKIFDRLMKDAYDTILRTAPADVAEYIRSSNLEVVAEDVPSDEVLDEMGCEEPEDLLGLHETGASLDDVGDANAPTLPDRVIVYRKSIEAACDSLAEAKREVMLTLIHEIAHHVGFEEDAMDRWEDEIEREREEKGRK
jgi:predicted Zn-dependent protease with MMP-like domain